MNLDLDLNDNEPDPVWAVINPSHPKAAHWYSCLKDDALRLQSSWIYEMGSCGTAFFKVHVPLLRPEQLIRICRALSKASGGEVSETGAFLVAIQGEGIFIASHLCYVCSDPVIGRDYFAARSREKGGS